MGGGISGNKDGAARVAAELRALKAQNAAIMRALRGLGIQIDTTTGDLIVGGGRSIQVNDGGGTIINDGGKLQMATPAGYIVLQAGRMLIPDGSGRTQQVIVFARDDGTPAMYIADLGTIPGHPHQQSLAITDRAGNVIFAEDTVSGKGIALPNLGGGGWFDINMPTMTTTSTTFQELVWNDVLVQQPQFMASALVYSAAGTAGQVRVKMRTAGVTTVVTGSTVNVASGSFTVVYFPTLPFPSYTPGTRTLMIIEARVTSGTGALGVRGAGFLQAGS